MFKCMEEDIVSSAKHYLIRKFLEEAGNKLLSREKR